MAVSFLHWLFLRVFLEKLKLNKVCLRGPRGLLLDDPEQCDSLKISFFPQIDNEISPCSGLLSFESFFRCYTRGWQGYILSNSAIIRCQSVLKTEPRPLFCFEKHKIEKKKLSCSHPRLHFKPLEKKFGFTRGIWSDIFSARYSFQTG